jgi:hypothetical protein
MLTLHLLCGFCKSCSTSRRNLHHPIQSAILYCHVWTISSRSTTCAKHLALLLPRMEIRFYQFLRRRESARAITKFPLKFPPPVASFPPAATHSSATTHRPSTRHKCREICRLPGRAHASMAAARHGALPPPPPLPPPSSLHQLRQPPLHPPSTRCRVRASPLGGALCAAGGQPWGPRRQVLPG